MPALILFMHASMPIDLYQRVIRSQPKLEQQREQVHFVSKFCKITNLHRFWMLSVKIKPFSSVFSFDSTGPSAVVIASSWSIITNGGTN